MAVPVNGVYFDWGCLTIDFGGVRYDNEFNSISYKETASFAKLPGRGRRPKGETRGKLEYEGELKLSRALFKTLIEQLGGSNWRNARPNITCSYGFDGDDASAQEDKLVSVRLHSPDNSAENNEEELMVTLSMSPLDIVWAGEDENDRQ